MDMVNNVMWVVGILLLITAVYVMFVIGYGTIIGFWGYKKAKRDYKLIDDKARFLILVAAHNEETVIASTVENLGKIDYDSSKFDVYVVNDNSTDDTEGECQRIGAKYINTNGGLFPREGVGKPGGLQYALRALGFEKIKDKYDLVMILDADNHVDKAILKELNSQWHGKGKPEAIQTYLDSKNHDKSLSLGYTVAYIMANRFFQLAKYRLGLPNAIGGTGFAVTSEYLISSGGFNYESLTEDLEMEIEIVRNGGRVLWNHLARIYDEKPDDLKISVRQRTRWMQGHWYVAFKNFFPLWKKFFTTGKWRYVDQLIYLFSGGKAIQLVIMGVSILLSGAVLIATKDSNSLYGSVKILYTSLLGTGLFSIAMFLYGVVFQGYYALRVDKGMSLSIKSVFSLFYYSYTFLYCNVLGLFKHKQQGVWVKTHHKVTERKDNT